jgi:hypothetical protein
MESVNDRFSGLILATKHYISLGLLYPHTRMTENTKKILKSLFSLYALTELLGDELIISIEELYTRRSQVSERLVKKFAGSPQG